MGERKRVESRLHVGDRAVLPLATRTDVITCASSGWAGPRSYCGCIHSTVEVRYGGTTVIIMRVSPEFLFAMRTVL